MIQFPQRILAQLGRRYGNDPLLVQAAGGNVSIKSAPHRMTIKTSGVRLREMTDSFGWAVADHHRIRAGLGRISGLDSWSAREKAYVRLLERATRTPGKRVSMEAGFHAILPEAYVLHLHSLAGILLGMMQAKTARRLIQDACEDPPRVSFAPAKLPGFELTYRMIPAATSRGVQPIQLWIQRNHGVVWSGPDAQALIRTVARFERSLRTHFQLRNYPPPHRHGSSGCRAKTPDRPARASSYRVGGTVCFCRWPDCDFVLEPVFPDFVIYFNLWGGADPDVIKSGRRSVWIGAGTPAQWRDKKEVVYAHALASTLARRWGWYKPLPSAMIRRLKSMETERLRMKQILKS